MALLGISKTVMDKLWDEHLKPKYGNKIRLCHMDTDSSVIEIETEDFCADIADDVEKWFDTSNYEIVRPLPTGKNKKVIGLMKGELRGRIMIECAALKLKTYAYLIMMTVKLKKQKEQRNV